METIKTIEAIEKTPLTPTSIVTTPCVSDNREEPELPSFLDFSSNIDMHGYAHIGSANRGCRRLLWRILFVGAILLSCMMFRDSVKNYFEYTVYVETENFNFLQDDMTLPTITICNKVPLIKQGYERVKKIVDITPLEFEEFYIRYITRYRRTVPPNPSVEKKIFDAMARNNVTTAQEMIELFEIGYTDMFENPLSSIFLNTRAGNRDYPTCRYDYNRKCTTKPVISRKESLCHQVNFYEEGKAPRKGWQHERQKFGNMIAVVNTARNDGFMREHEVRAQAPYMDLVEGLVIYIHSYGHLHENSPNIERIFLRPGKWHYLKMDLTEVHHLGPPYAYECGTQPYKRINGSRFSYTKDMCKLDCQLDLKYKACGCIGWEFSGLVDLPICNVTHNHCFINQPTVVTKCKLEKYCPNDCVQYKYNVHVETMDILDDSVYDRASKVPGWKLNQTETENYINDNLVGVQLEYTNFAKIDRHRAAVTWKNLVGTIGGTLGLCAGFSIMVIFEFLQYVCDYISLLLIKRRKKKN